MTSRFAVGQLTITGATFRDPRDVAHLGNTLVVADTAADRVLRFIDNAAPVVTGGGTLEVEEGQTASFTLEIVDPDGDNFEVTDPEDPTLSEVESPVTFDMPADLVTPGDSRSRTIVVTDDSPRARSTTVTLTWVLLRRDEAGTTPTGTAPDTTDPLPSNRPPEKEPAPREPSGCSAGVASSVWMVGLLGLMRRKRRGKNIRG